MKKFAVIGLCIALCIGAASCKSNGSNADKGGNNTEITEKSDDMKQVKTAAQIYDEIKALEVLPEMLDMDAEFISNYYDIDAEKLKDYVFATSLVSIRVDTVIIATAKDSADLEDLKLKIQKFRDAKAAEMKNYLADQYEIVNKSEVKTKGNTVYLVISEKSGDIEKIIETGIE